MKVLCINDKNSIGGKFSFYTEGKWYKVVEKSHFNDHMFFIESDNGTYPAVERKNFISAEELRERKLKELGIV
jgi:hypothetical protein